MWSISALTQWQWAQVVSYYGLNLDVGVSSCEQYFPHKVNGKALGPTLWMNNQQYRQKKFTIGDESIWWNICYILELQGKKRTGVLWTLKYQPDGNYVNVWAFEKSRMGLKITNKNPISAEIFCSDYNLIYNNISLYYFIWGQQYLFNKWIMWMNKWTKIYLNKLT